MKKIIGILIMAISTLGITYFESYKGTVIPYPTLWLIGFVVLEVLGFYLIYLSIYKQQSKIHEKVNYQLENFKANAEKIELTLDNCEVKNGSFSHEVEDPRFSSVRFLVPNSSLYSFDSTITETVVRSYLIYSDPKDNGGLRYISQTFPLDEITLKYYVMNKRISLYVDRFNKEKYYFEMK